jgi:small subunit ribosomal protein S16
MGRKKRPYYRVVVAEHTAPRDGAFLEILGHYDPLADEAALVIKEDRVKHWLEHGAQPTKTVHHLLAKQDLMAPWEAKPRSKRADAKRAAIAEAAKAAAEAESGDSSAASGGAETETAAETNEES